MKKVLLTLIILAVIGAGGYGVYHFYFENTEAGSSRVSSDSADAVYVDSITSITGYGSGNGLIDRYSGVAEAQATLEVKLDSGRTLAETFVKEGDVVEEGQALFSYDTQEDEDKIAQAQLEIDKAEAGNLISEKSIEEYQKLMAKANSSDQLQYSLSIAEAENAIRQNEYTIKTKQWEIEKCEANIADATVYAEMGGIIQKIGDSSDTTTTYYGSSSDSSAYITILANGDFRIKGTVNEQNYYNIWEGMPMLIHSRVDSSQTWTGFISEINTEQDEEENNYYYYYGSSDTSTYTFYVELDGSDGLMLGQHVYMEADQGQEEEKTGLWLEEYYIMQEDGSAYVWLANSSNVIEKHEITLGDYDEDLMQYEVLEGLEADDYIAFPMEGISEGDPVIYNDLYQDDGFMDADDEDVYADYE